MAILDTNFLIDIDNNRPEALAKAREIEAAGRPRTVPTVVAFELWVGVGKGSEAEANRDRFERLLDGLPRAELTPAVAKRAGEIEGAVQAAGSDDAGVGTVDAVVAATSIERGEPAVTDDRDLTTRIPEDANVSLDVEAYAQ